jgi:hypothetical protein
MVEQESCQSCSLLLLDPPCGLQAARHKRVTPIEKFYGSSPSEEAKAIIVSRSDGGAREDSGWFYKPHVSKRLRSAPVDVSTVDGRTVNTKASATGGVIVLLDVS